MVRSDVHVDCVRHHSCHCHADGSEFWMMASRVLAALGWLRERLYFGVRIWTVVLIQIFCAIFVLRILEPDRESSNL